MTRQFVTFKIGDDGDLHVELLAEGRAEITDYHLDEKPTIEALCELFEYQLGNGWSWVSPEALGALTDAPILSNDAKFDDQGNLVGADHIWWHAQYMVEDPIKALLEKGEVVFRKGE